MSACKDLIWRVARGPILDSANKECTTSHRKFCFKAIIQTKAGEIWAETSQSSALWPCGLGSWFPLVLASWISCAHTHRQQPTGAEIWWRQILTIHQLQDSSRKKHWGQPWWPGPCGGSLPSNRRLRTSSAEAHPCCMGPVWAAATTKPSESKATSKLFPAAPWLWGKADFRSRKAFNGELI